MLSVEDRSLVVSFADRVSKREGVYVRCRRGKVRSRVEQVWRIDGDDLGCFDVGELVDEITARLLQNPSSDEKSWVELVAVGKTLVLDQCCIGPLDVPEVGPAENPQTISVLTHALVTHTSQTMASRDGEVYWYRRQLEELRAELTAASIEAAELRALLGVEALEHPDIMVTAIEHFAPIARDGLRLLVAKKSLELRAAAAKETKALPGPTQDAPDQEVDTADQGEEQETTPDEYATQIASIIAELRPQVPAETFQGPALAIILEALGAADMAVPTVTTWTPTAAEQVATLLIRLADEAPDVAGPQIDRLMNSSVGTLVASHLGFG